MTAILKQDPPELPESVPPAVREIVAHCLEKDAANRFQSAKDLSFALAHSGTPSGKAAALSPPPPRARRVLLPVAAIAVLPSPWAPVSAASSGARPRRRLGPASCWEVRRWPISPALPGRAPGRVRGIGPG